MIIFDQQYYTLYMNGVYNIANHSILYIGGETNDDFTIQG